MLVKSGSKFFKIWNTVVYWKQNDFLVFYVTEEMESSMFKYHDEFGYLDAERTYNVIKMYWFPEIKSKIVKHVKNC